MKYSQREGYTPKESCNGCGSGWSAKLIPDNILFMNIRPICCIHDDRYEHGTTIEEKEEYDREFRNNLLRKIDSMPWYFPESLAKPIANFYYRKVRDYGGPAYWKDK